MIGKKPRFGRVKSLPRKFFSQYLLYTSVKQEKQMRTSKTTKIHSLETANGD